MTSLFNEVRKAYSQLTRDVPYLHFQWNSHGYDVAKIFSGKFTYISPVWLQIRWKPGGAFVVTGGHDIDKGQSTTH